MIGVITVPSFLLIHEKWISYANDGDFKALWTQSSGYAKELCNTTDEIKFDCFIIKLKKQTMLKSFLIRYILLLSLMSSFNSLYAQSTEIMENQNFKIVVDKNNGAISSFVVKQNNSDLISEKRLISNFRICLQTDNDLSNYIDGIEQKAKFVTKDGNTIAVVVSGMTSPKGTYPIDLTYWIKMEDDYVSFKAKLTNHSKYQVAEFWFPRIGGMKEFGNKEAKLAVPGYSNDCQNNIELFKNFPGRRRFGAEAAEWSTDYPGGGQMCMPWLDIYDAKNNVGLYLGYHDTICRFSTWHMYLTPDLTDYSGKWLTEDQSGGKPVGITLSHVFYPFIHSGETLNSGEFIVRVHKNDWHGCTDFYRQWFVSHFPFDKSKSWLRKERSWFTSIIYQPEDHVVTNFEGYNQWTKDAKKYGINCYELIGWNSGGLERNYPLYIPEDKLGGVKGFKNLLSSIKQRGDHCLVFVNYNILDGNTEWYKKELHKYVAQDQLGNVLNCGAWGESTLMARKGLSVRHHLFASVVPPMENILDKYLTQLVRDGAQGFQIDKDIIGRLDFNPLNTAKPDVAQCEEQLKSMGKLYKKWKTINPDFCIASESGCDRQIAFVDVGYRNSWAYQISPLKYVFPEWASCQHVTIPRDFQSVNAGVMTGSVLCMEPEIYQGTLDQPLYHELANYIKEIERIRKELSDIIFLGDYLDNQDAKVNAVNEKLSNALHFKVWRNPKTDQYAIIIANESSDAIQLNWEFTDKNIKQVMLYEPFREPVVVKRGTPITIKAQGVQILIEKKD